MLISTSGILCYAAGSNANSAGRPRTKGMGKMKKHTRKPMVAGNWKMNGLKSSKREVTAMVRRLNSKTFSPRCEVVVCPPSTTLLHLRDAAKGSPVKMAGQDCHWNPSGAHTGDLSAEMLKDAGARLVIVGHSERRSDHGETDAVVNVKAQAAHRAGLTAVICVGETEAERKAGRTLRVIGAQLKGSLPAEADAKNTVIAYEPVWAIGTGLTPTPEDVAEVHGYIRKRVAALLCDEIAAKLRILYGGSVKPANAEELMAVENVDGALVGGASLKATDFLGIIAAYL